MNALKLLQLFLICFLVSCGREGKPKLDETTPHFVMVGNQDEGVGKVIVGMGDTPTVLLLSGNYLFASGEKLAPDKWVFKILQLKPKQEEASLMINTGSQMYYNDDEELLNIDGAFTLNGSIPTWTGKYADLEDVIPSAVKTNK
ncbi:hypothetical protein HW115_18890 [Verrucomicrobiaceae bacterium N1E253]|uniref:Uncharacterized protein n=1 Tax=Oceaniferula marina TaxID=2748318 RepID=A0A851GKW5_9BACT|nr:hypothetical protein [Oceaniferula marina]NWK57692.1 hypothetical protein [Oceaniferula marina]